MYALNRTLVVAAAAAALIAAGCAKKKAATATPPAPAVPQAPAAPERTQTAVRQATPQPSKPSEPTRSRTPDAATRARIDQLLAKIEDAYFDYNQHSLRPDAIQALQADSTELRDILRDYPDYKLTIEGHCDERGSADYNLALGDAR